MDDGRGRYLLSARHCRAAAGDRGADQVPAVRAKVAPRTVREEEKEADDGRIVLITGASGFIGSAHIQRLADRYTLVGLDWPGGAYPSALAHAIELDLGSNEPVREALEKVRSEFGGRIASVIHLAGILRHLRRAEPALRQDHRPGHAPADRRTSRSNSSCWPPPRWCTGRRTCRTRGSTRDGLIDPKWAYPESKVKAEQLLRDRHGDVPVVLTHCRRL